MRQYTGNTPDSGATDRAEIPAQSADRSVSEANGNRQCRVDVTETDVHVVVASTRRRVEIARRSFALGNGRGGHSVTVTEVRGDRRFVVDFPASALDAAISALVSLRSSIVGEVGLGSTQRRNAPMHGSWTKGRGAR